MKQIIALILFPIRTILLLFKGVWEVMMEPLINGTRILIKINYDFWAEIFKWKGSE